MLDSTNTLIHIDISRFFRLGFGLLLLFAITRWQRTYDELKQVILAERFLYDDKLNSYLSERLGPNALLRARMTFLRLCPSASTCRIVPPFVHYESRQIVAPKYGISTCIIYKNMSTIMTAIMCYFYDAVAYRRHVSDMNSDTYTNRHCKEKNEYNSIRALALLRNSSSTTNLHWHNIVVVREPLERFISGFLNKCLHDTNRKDVCYNCGRNIACVLKRQYERLMGCAQSPSLYHTVEDAHFAPQSWHCELRDNIRNYKIIKYTGSNTTRMLDELDIEFSKRGVPQGILTDIRSQVLRKRTFHETYNSHERVVYENQLRSSPHLMKLLVKMFYYDYLLFGFPLPHIK